MPKKLFSWIKKSDKSQKSNGLVTDAVTLDANYGNRSDSSERVQSISPLSAEASTTPNIDNQSVALRRTNDVMVESNYASTVSNTQQNILNFANIQGLHIGPNLQISNYGESSSVRGSTSGEAILKTTSIDGTLLCFYFLSRF